VGSDQKNVITSARREKRVLERVNVGPIALR
jgi:hypothetical protein